MPDHESTAQLGVSLAETIGDRAVIALSGPLGAGKTTLVQAVAKTLGVEEIVNSPTFTMLNEYHSGRLPLYHMDLYRLSEGGVASAVDMLLAELDEIMDDPMVAMIEWAELLAQQGNDYLHQLDHVVIEISYAENESDPSSAYYARAHARTRNEGDAAKSYIKDEIGRVARLQARGGASSALLDKLAQNITDMLIYS